MRHERHEYYTTDTSATRVKNFDLDNDTRENIFSHPYISYIPNKRLQGEENAFEKCITKSELCNRKSYIKKLYTRL